MAIDEGFAVIPPTAVPTSGLDLAKLASGRVVEARVASLAQGIAVVATRHGLVSVDLAAFGADPPAVGDLVRLQVRPIEGRSDPEVVLVERGAAPTPTPAGALPGEDPAAVLARAVRGAAGRQTGLVPLYAALAGLAGVSDGVPEPVRALVGQLLSVRLADAAPPTAAAVKKAFLGSGLFLESRMATGTPAADDDLKAGLLALRAALTKWLGAARSPAPPAGDAAGGREPTGRTSPRPTVGYGPPVGRTSSPAGPAAPVAGGSGAPAAPLAGGPSAAPDPAPPVTTSGPRAAGEADPRPGAAGVDPTVRPAAGTGGLDEEVSALLLRAVLRGLEAAGSLTAARPAEVAAALAALAGEHEGRPPPPRRGQPTRGQAAQAAERLDPATGVEGLGRRALERTEGALARILLEQFATLDGAGDDAAAATTAPPRAWTAEMPIATPAGTGVVQMTVERDGGRRATGETSAGRAWRVCFSLDVEPLGPVHARIGWAGAGLSIGLWAERPDTATRLGAEVGRLRGALEAAAVQVEAIRLTAGRPAAGGGGGGHLVDVEL